MNQANFDNFPVSTTSLHFILSKFDHWYKMYEMIQVKWSKLVNKLILYYVFMIVSPRQGMGALCLSVIVSGSWVHCVYWYITVGFFLL